MKNTRITKNIIAFRKGFFITNKGKKASYQEQMSIQAELMQFGYILSKEAMDMVNVSWFEEVMPYIQNALGASKNYSPFYKNFPKQVMEMSHCELFTNAILHYFSLGTWEPSYELLDRGFKYENVNFRTIKLGSEQEFENIFTTLVSINQSLTEDDKNIVEWFMSEHKNGRVKLVMPESVPFKETLCMLASHGLDVPVKTTTDVLRIATYLSGGDISLPAIPKITIGEVKQNRKSWMFQNLKDAQISAREKFKFKKFSRAERKYLLGLLEKTNLDLGDMKLKLGRWLRLGEIVHPGEYKSKFPKSFNAFKTLREDVGSARTFHSLVDESFAKDYKKGIQMLSKRPGEFSRKLDWMLRTYKYNTDFVLETFKGISDKVSTKVLWELYNHFLKRNSASPRTIMTKGKGSKMTKLEDLKPMSNILVNKIHNTILESVKNNFSKLDSLGGVWIDDRLKKIPLPFAMRSVNSSVQTYIRGTRVPFNKDAKVVRPYIHWFDENGDQDLDLSAGFYGENLKSLYELSYRSLKNERINSCHSGDVRYKQGACAEYVDIDIQKCLKAGVRYVVVQVHNFENRPMHTLKDCVFGLMEREFPESNKIFVPKTITNAVKVANESSTVDVCILDLKEREYIWADVESQSRGLSNIESTSENTQTVLHSLIAGSEKLSVYDLISLHAEARGKIVSDKEEAETKFEYEDLVTSYEKIAKFM